MEYFTVIKELKRTIFKSMLQFHFILDFLPLPFIYINTLTHTNFSSTFWSTNDKERTILGIFID